MSFDDVEKSVQSANPVELYSFTAPIQTWYLTTAEKDIVFGGQTYVATTGSRSSLMTADAATDPTDVTIELPAGHGFPQTYANNSMPPREVAVTVQRYYPDFGFALQFWQGFVAGMSFKRGSDGPVALIRVPSGTADQLQADVPNVRCRRLCNNQLFDPMCTIARAGFQVVTTINAISADGKTITIPATLPAAVNGVPWSRHGEVLHASSTERRTIIDQPLTNQIIIQAPFPANALHIGDPITVFAGCDHQLGTCNTKFTNVPNFQGYPYLPNSNVFYVGLLSMRTS